MGSDVVRAARSLGPQDPETFYKAQKRNRRATWRMVLLCLLAALLMGIPLTLVLTPLFYAAAFVVAEILNYFSMLPPGLLDNLNALGKLAFQVADYYINGKGQIDPQTLALGLAVMLLPGIVIAFLLWIGVLTLFRRGGVGGTLASLNAREPNRNDIKELQLIDVVEEMAIAAGLPVPKLMLVDSPGANAAAIGTSSADARLVISRRLLDDLNRDQMEALLGQLIGSIGNGDLRVAFMVTSVFETCGLLVTLINSPFGRESRSILWRILRYGFSRGSSDAAHAAEADAVASLLSRSLEMGKGDIDRFFDAAEQKRSLWRKMVRTVFFPIFFTNVAIELTLGFFLNLLLGPCMALIWRTRRYLADASSVHLTRNPDALATALQTLNQDSTAVPGSVWASHLFVLDPKGDSTARTPRQFNPDQMRQALLAWQSTTSNGGAAPQNTPATQADFERGLEEFKQTQRAAMHGDPAAIARLVAFGKVMTGGAINFPNPADIVAAQHGDRAAIARLRAQHETKPQLSNTGLQTQSAISFHPPLKRRLKRLNRMGAHIALGRRKMGVGGTIVMAVLFLILGPLMLVAGAAMLAAIGMMIMLNLFFLGLWLAIIHAIFFWLGHR